MPNSPEIYNEISSPLSNIFTNSVDDIVIEIDLEEELKTCRICLETDYTDDNPLIAPCYCTGTSKYVHRNCLEKWRQTNPVNSLARKQCGECHCEYRIYREGISIPYIWNILDIIHNYNCFIFMSVLLFIYLLGPWLCNENVTPTTKNNYYLGFYHFKCETLLIGVYILINIVLHLYGMYKLNLKLSSSKLIVFLNTYLISLLICFLNPISAIILFSLWNNSLYGCYFKPFIYEGNNNEYVLNYR